MGGRAGGSYRTGKGAKGKPARLSTRRENGPRTLMIKVTFFMCQIPPFSEYKIFIVVRINFE
jgi:hypothetical protein